MGTEVDPSLSGSKQANFQLRWPLRYWFAEEKKQLTIHSLTIFQSKQPQLKGLESPHPMVIFKYSKHSHKTIFTQQSTVYSIGITGLLCILEPLCNINVKIHTQTRASLTAEAWKIWKMLTWF